VCAERKLGKEHLKCEQHAMQMLVSTYNVLIFRYGSVFHDLLLPPGDHDDHPPPCDGELPSSATDTARYRHTGYAR
jgi:hypothetical protein